MELEIRMRSVGDLRPSPGNARTHSKKQIRQIADAIREFGFTNPLLINAENQVIAGHGRLEAAKLLGFAEVPAIAIRHLSSDQERALALADNKIALNSGWDQEKLGIELQALLEIEFDVQLTGFSIAEVDLVLDAAAESLDSTPVAKEDAAVPIGDTAVTRVGDIWILGRHRLLCGDAQDPECYSALLQGERVDLGFTDPPYNVRIDGNVSGLGRTKHREFEFASGEMSEAQFTAFLEKTLGNLAAHARDGAIVFVCMDWRHAKELLVAGERTFTALKNLVVWNKTNGGMGTFYRSKHELIFVYKVGTAPHTNTFGLGDSGRYRTNVWDYAGVNTFSATRAEDQAMHPTVKPVALVADAIRDCSNRGEIVLDPFGGSGTTLIAAQKTGRRARLIEYDPLYCDTIVRRFEKLTGKVTKLAGTDLTFEDVAEQRAVEVAA